MLCPRAALDLAYHWGPGQKCAMIGAEALSIPAAKRIIKFLLNWEYKMGNSEFDLNLTHTSSGDFKQMDRVLQSSLRLLQQSFEKKTGVVFQGSLEALLMLLRPVASVQEVCGCSSDIEANKNDVDTPELCLRVLESYFKAFPVEKSRAHACGSEAFHLLLLLKQISKLKGTNLQALARTKNKEQRRGRRGG